MSSNIYALLIGCNYTGTQNELYGCQNDVIKYLPILTDAFGYKPENIITLMDKAGYEYPTFANITKYMNWLIQKSQGADELTFYYSGHGSNIRDKSADEPDRMDECIVPLDFNQNGFILDDYIYLNFLSKLKPVGRFVMVFDSCNSASCTDLPYSFTIVNNKIVKQSLSKRNPIPSNPNIFVLSGCWDPKYSMDTTEPNGDPCGLLSYSLRQSLVSSNYNMTIGETLVKIKNNIGNIDQTPVVSVNSGNFTQSTPMFVKYVQPNSKPNTKPNTKSKDLFRRRDEGITMSQIIKLGLKAKYHHGHHHKHHKLNKLADKLADKLEDTFEDIFEKIIL